VPRFDPPRAKHAAHHRPHKPARPHLLKTKVRGRPPPHPRTTTCPHPPRPEASPVPPSCIPVRLLLLRRHDRDQQRRPDHKKPTQHRSPCHRRHAKPLVPMFHAQSRDQNQGQNPNQHPDPAPRPRRYQKAIGASPARGPLHRHIHRLAGAVLRPASGEACRPPTRLRLRPKAGTTSVPHHAHHEILGFPQSPPLCAPTKNLTPPPSP
jgi:hypothetical protein